MRGWKIDSNLATLRRSERTPPGSSGGAQPHHPPSLLPSLFLPHAGTSTIIAPAASFYPAAFSLRPFFPSSRNPRRNVGLVRTHPYTSRKLISGLLSSGSFARAVNKPGVAPPGFPTPSAAILRALPVPVFRPFLAPAAINVVRASSPPRSVAAFSRHANDSLADRAPTSFNG